MSSPKQYVNARLCSFSNQHELESCNWKKSMLLHKIFYFDFVIDIKLHIIAWPTFAFFAVCIRFRIFGWMRLRKSVRNDHASAIKSDRTSKKWSPNDKSLANFAHLWFKPYEKLLYENENVWNQSVLTQVRVSVYLINRYNANVLL